MTPCLLFFNVSVLDGNPCSNVPSAFPSAALPTGPKPWHRLCAVLWCRIRRWGRRVEGGFFFPLLWRDFCWGWIRSTYGEVHKFTDPDVAEKPLFRPPGWVLWAKLALVTLLNNLLLLIFLRRSQKHPELRRAHLHWDCKDQGYANN